MSDSITVARRTMLWLDISVASSSSYDDDALDKHISNGDIDYSYRIVQPARFFAKLLKI
jgi:hypothetical protein